MNKKILSKVLNKEIPKALDEIHYLNSGGCGYMALALHDELKLRGIPSTMRLYSSWEDKVNSAEIDANLESGDSLPNGHVVVLIGTRHYDSNGAYTVGKRVCGDVTRPQMKKMLQQKERWNNTFNRKQIPKLRKLVKAAFANAR